MKKSCMVQSTACHDAMLSRSDDPGDPRDPETDILCLERKIQRVHVNRISGEIFQPEPRRSLGVATGPGNRDADRGARARFRSGAGPNDQSLVANHQLIWPRPERWFRLLSGAGPAVSSARVARSADCVFFLQQSEPFPVRF